MLIRPPSPYGFANVSTSSRQATIAAALIASRAVDVASILSGSQWAHDGASVRLRDLTDYVYQMITETKADPTQTL